MLNPGAGAVIESMIEVIATVDYASPKVKNPPLLMLEVLAERLNLLYDSGEASRAL